MQLVQQRRDSVTLEELAIPFSARICEHAKTAARQSINRSNKFLDACPGFNAGTIALEELTSVTVQSSFRYVLDAFRVVNASQVTMTFFEKDFTRGSNALPGIGLMPRAGDENLRERVPDGQKRREFSLERRIGAHIVSFKHSPSRFRNSRYLKVSKPRRQYAEGRVGGCSYSSVKRGSPFRWAFWQC